MQIGPKGEKIGFERSAVTLILTKNLHLRSLYSFYIQAVFGKSEHESEMMVQIWNLQRSSMTFTFDLET